MSDLVIWYAHTLATGRDKTRNLSIRSDHDLVKSWRINAMASHANMASPDLKADHRHSTPRNAGLTRSLGVQTVHQTPGSRTSQPYPSAPAF